jgi:chlorobactene glucosyltransferase
MPTFTEFLWALPWILLAFAAPFVFSSRPRIDEHAAPPADDSPLVSVIVPARNEAENIGACASSLLASTYPRREIIIIDDNSTDGTGDIVRVLAERGDGDVQLIVGKPLPDGWLGKCWACWQGYEAARGELLVFTDADTRHARTFLGHAVGALRTARVDLLSVVPHQLMESFWERVILPHVFAVLRLRWPDLRRINRADNPRNVMANGQFLLFTRTGYEAIGGHRGVRSEVVEDQLLAQKIIHSGRRLYVAHAENMMQTRMYRSLSGIIEGWSKNLATGARSIVPRPIRPIFPWLIGLAALVVWVGPAAAFIASLFTPLPPGMTGWSGIASAASAAFWLFMYHQFHVPFRYAFLFPIGGLMTGFIFLRSALRGQTVHWKGRTYTIQSAPPERRKTEAKSDRT